RIKDSVPLLTAHGAGYGGLVCLGVFFYLIDHLGKALRPSGALRAVARLESEVIESVYPRPFTELQDGTGPEVAHVPGGEPAATIPSPKDGVVLAFDQAGLLSLAQRVDCVIELVPQVGDHVAAGDPLFRLFSGGATLPAEVLCQAVAVGQERTLEQD